ncbi:MAG: PadR family transcriptional regulator [Roseivirga sp.]|nr:PadR family transcriptional regulator [Roseivirga sp.]
MSSKELTGASTIPIILSVLSGGENYGYAIIKQVADFSGGKLDWSEPMLYPVLHRMDKQGLIKAEWRVLKNGRKRKYYSITDEGREALLAKKEEWIDMIKVMTQLWDLKLAGS